MKNYLIERQLRIGDYEKANRTLVRAEDEESATLQALQGESHGDDAGFDEQGEWWDMGEMVYSVRSIKELTDVEADMYEQLINPYKNSGDVEAQISLDKAEQQLLGYKQRHSSISDVASSMGLTLTEFNRVIEEYPSTIDDEDIRELQESYFKVEVTNNG